MSPTTSQGREKTFTYESHTIFFLQTLQIRSHLLKLTLQQKNKHKFYFNFILNHCSKVGIVLFVGQCEKRFHIFFATVCFQCVKNGLILVCKKQLSSSLQKKDFQRMICIIHIIRRFFQDKKNDYNLSAPERSGAVIRSG